MEINIQVEIGTEEQQEAIKAEMKMILGWLGEEFLKYIDLRLIIIPAEFDATVNRLQNTTSYTSDRLQRCVGKIIECEGNNTVVISSLAYTDLMTFGHRCKFIFHELYHLVNRKHFKIPDYTRSAETRYTNTVAIMYDEYSANCFANSLLLSLEEFGMFGDVQGDMMREYKGFLLSLQADEDYYLPIKAAYEDWRENNDTVKMLNTIVPYVDAAIKYITYCYAFADKLESIKTDLAEQKSRFLNADTKSLFTLFSEWFATKESAPDFGAGIDMIRTFMSVCFGIVFSDTLQGERFDLVPY
jgi:hypothetical protein